MKIDGRISPFVLDFKSAITPFMRGADECWIWTRNRIHGYGRFQQRGVYFYAHRVSYETFVGPITDGLHVLHRCDNPSCINPGHLFLGTQSDNTLDMWAKGRHRNPIFLANKVKTHCKHGHEFTPENTYMAKNRHGLGRACKQCSFERTRRIRSHRKRPVST